MDSNFDPDEIRAYRDRARPLVDSLRDSFTAALAAFGDDDRATYEVLLGLHQLVSVGDLGPEDMVGLVAMMARRLSYHQPRLRVSAN